MSEQPQNPPEPLRDLAAMFPPEQAPPPVSEPASAPHALEQKITRDLNGLIARVDQHAEEIRTLNVLLLAQAFAFGALAGIVFLLQRELRSLA